MVEGCDAPLGSAAMCQTGGEEERGWRESKCRGGGACGWG